MEAGEALVQPVRLDTEDGPVVYRAVRADAQSSAPTTGCKVGTQVPLTSEQEGAIAAHSVEVCRRAFNCVASEVEVLCVLPPMVGGHVLSSTIDKYASDIKANTNIEVRV
jgi:hypothetical protein